MIWAGHFNRNCCKTVWEWNVQKYYCRPSFGTERPISSLLLLNGLGSKNVASENTSFYWTLTRCSRRSKKTVDPIELLDVNITLPTYLSGQYRHAHELFTEEQFHTRCLIDLLCRRASHRLECSRHRILRVSSAFFGVPKTN